MVSLFFTKETFGQGFFDYKDLKALNPFFKKAELGIQLSSQAETIQDKMLQLKAATTFERFLLFLEILHDLAKMDTSALLKNKAKNIIGENEGKRMSDVMEYTFANFQKEIDLSDISRVANLSPNAFCRFFKKRTNKSSVNKVKGTKLKKKQGGSAANAGNCAC